MSETEVSVRDQGGRFVAGHPGMGGRPRRAIEQDYLAVLSDEVPLDRWKVVIQRALADAERGDAKAREWLGGYLAGRPTGNGLAWLAAHEQTGADPIATTVNDVSHNARVAALLSAWGDRVAGPAPAGRWADGAEIAEPRGRLRR